MDIFDEIIQCLQNEKDQYGNVFVSRDTLAQFFADAPPRAATKTVQIQKQPEPQGTCNAVRSVKDRRTEHRDGGPVPSGDFSMNRSAESPLPPLPETTSQQDSPRRMVPPSPEAVAAMDWDQLRHAVFRCRGCRLCETRTNVVFADGNEHAELMFIGEGPGADEDAQGVPFVGKAGQLLTKMIAAMQFKREEVYIANIVKCRPPGNRNPTDDEMAACLPYLLRQIELVRPKVIVLLGSVALKGLLNRSGIMRMRGHWLDYRGIMVMPTFHPAYLLRYEAGKKDAWSDLQQVMKVFGKVYRKSR